MTFGTVRERYILVFVSIIVLLCLSTLSFAGDYNINSKEFFVKETSGCIGIEDEANVIGSGLDSSALCPGEWSSGNEWVFNFDEIDIPKEDILDMKLTVYNYHVSDVTEVNDYDESVFQYCIDDFCPVLESFDSDNKRPREATTKTWELDVLPEDFDKVTFSVKSNSRKYTDYYSWVIDAVGIKVHYKDYGENPPVKQEYTEIVEETQQEGVSGEGSMIGGLQQKKLADVQPAYDYGTQGYAEIGKPVKWVKSIDSYSNSIKIPSSVSDVRAFKDINGERTEIKTDIQENKLILEDTGNIDIEYTTEAPRVAGRMISNTKKEVIISSDFHYTNVMAYTTIPESAESRIKFYRLGEGGMEEVKDVEYIDTNSNGLIDKLQWIVPHLSSETYIIIIEISAAEHLDQDREFLSDIYQDVKYLDGSWSEPINHGEYVRVTFEKALTSSNDITIYPRNLQGLETKMEVYLKDSDEKITEFPVIGEERYYKVYLTGMAGEHDTFDLKIVNLDSNPGAYLEFNHIIDPETTSQNLYYLTGASRTGTSGTGGLSESTGSAAAVWETNADGQSYTWIKGYTETTTIKNVLITVEFYCNATTTEGGDKVQVDDLYIYDCGTSSDCSSQDATICSALAQDIACDYETNALSKVISCTPATARNLSSGDYLGVRLVADINDGKTPDLRLWFNTSTLKTNVTINETTYPPDGIVSWNQSSLDMGSNIQGDGNKTMIVKISSTATNNDTNVSCTGDCNQITTNWTMANMTDGESRDVKIICANDTSGSFQTVLRVNSSQDGSLDLLTVSCTMKAELNNPNINNLTVSSNRIRNGSSITITANVTDDTDVDYSKALIYYPNGTYKEGVELSQDGDLWTGSYTVSAPSWGNHTLKIWANDSFNNINNSYDLEEWFTPYYALSNTNQIIIDGVFSDWNEIENMTDAVQDSFTNTSTFIDVYASEHTTCGISANNTAYCWGGIGIIPIDFIQTNYRNLGDGLGKNATLPSAVKTSLIGAVTTFSHVSGGGEPFTCGLLTNGSAYCWGLNDYGQLGNGTRDMNQKYDGWYPYTPVNTSLIGTVQTFTQISPGYIEVYGLLSNGSIYNWGANQNYPQATDTSLIGAVQTFSQIDRGHLHTCGILTNGSAYCWGGNTYGQLGNGSNGSINDGSSPVPVKTSLIGDVQTFSQIAAGAHTTCGILTNGSAYCWGRSFLGELGNGTYTGSTGPGAVSPVPVKTSHIGAVDTFSELYGSFSCPFFNYLDCHGATVCGILTNGSAYCWGKNWYGELGNGTSEGKIVIGIGDQSASIPEPVNTSFIGSTTTFSHLSPGVYHTCGILTNGSIYCWGRNVAGEFGNGIDTGFTSNFPIASILPESITIGSDIKDISISNNDTYLFVVMSLNGSIDNSPTSFYRAYISNNESTGNQTTSLGDSLPFKYDYRVEINGSQCHLYNSTTGLNNISYCWFSNSSDTIEAAILLEDLGITSTADVIDVVFETSSTTEQYDLGPDGGSYIRFTTSESGAPTINSLSVSSNRIENGSSITITADVTDDSAVNAVKALLYYPNGTYIQDVELSNTEGTTWEGSYTVTAPPWGNYTLTAWANDSFNNINSDYEHWEWFTPYMNLSNSSNIIIDGAFTDWSGINNFSDITESSGYVSLINFTISSCSNTVCEMISNNTIYCWGYNWFGQIGNGSSSADANVYPVAVNTSFIGDVTTFSQISGGSTACGILTNGSAYCWGRNDMGQLGNGSLTGAVFPVAVNTSFIGDVTTFSQISTGDYHSCGILTNGSAYCWGSNIGGQLGNGSLTDAISPVAVNTSFIGAVKTFSQISAFAYQSCGILTNGSAYCWGDNDRGQIGNGSSDSINSGAYPVAVNTSFIGDVTTFSQILTGGLYLGAWGFAVGILTNGSAYSWGTNIYGQLGNGSLTGAVFPVAVNTSFIGDVTTFSQISADMYHVCGILTNNSAYCWGGNDMGQLGNGSLTGAISPVAVETSLIGDVQTFSSIDAGSQDTCGILTNGSAYCWGENYAGELGNGSLTDAVFPVAVSSIGEIEFISEFVSGDFDLTEVSLSNNETYLFAMIKMNGFVNFSTIDFYRIYISNNESTGNDTSPQSEPLPFKYDYRVEINGSQCYLYNSTTGINNISYCLISNNSDTLEVAILIDDLGIDSSDDLRDVVFETSSTTEQYDLAPDLGSFVRYEPILEGTTENIILFSNEPGTNAFDIVGNVDGNMTNGTAYSYNQTLTFQHPSWGKRFEAYGFFEGGQVNLSSLVIEASDEKTLINVTGVTGLNESHTIFIPNRNNAGVFVCPDVNATSMINGSCKDVVKFTYQEALAGTWKSSLGIEMEDSNYKISNLTSSGAEENNASEVGIVSPGNNTNTSDTTPTFTYNITDPDTDQTLTSDVYVYNGTLYQIGINTTTSPQTNLTVLNESNFTFDDGTYEWWVNVSDDYHTTQSEIRTITIDSTKPTLYVTSPEKGASYPETTIELNVTANEPISTWWYELNLNGSNETFTPNVTLEGISDTNSIIVCANDTANNINCSEVSFTIEACVIDIYINWYGVSFDTMLPGNLSNASLNADEGYNVTVSELTTCDVDLHIKGTELNTTDDKYSIMAGNVTWNNETNNYYASTSYNLTIDYRQFRTAVSPDSNATLYFWLDIPSITAGDYNGTLYIMGNETTG